MGVKIREKPPGSGVWWLFINHQGRRRSKRIGTDREIAEEVAEKVRARLVLGELNVEKINVRGPKFKQLADQWLALAHDWKDSTRECYRSDLERHVFATFGQRSVTAITRQDIKVFFDRLHADGLKLGTLEVIRAAFRGVLAYAVECDLIEVNPFDGIRFAYKRNKAEIDPLNEDEAALFLAASQTFMGGKYYPVLLCALRTGLRVGEIQALQWSDIDFDRRTIEVVRSWRKERVTRTKSKRRRRVDMSAQLADTLKAHRTAEKKKALRTGRPVSALVFTGERTERLNRISLKNAIDRCCESAKLRTVRTHDLRHSYATIRLMRGHNVGDVSYQLGHSSIKITYDNYVHWIPGKFKSEVDDLDAAHPAAPQAHPVENGG